MQLVIPDDILSETRLSAADLKREVALLLLRNHSISLKQASRLAEMPEAELGQLLRKPLLNVAALPKRDCIAGNPEELVHLDWSLESYKK